MKKISGFTADPLPKVPKGTAIIYACALALLAVLALVSHFIMGRVIARQQAATATVRAAGRQRTLSQAIASQAEQIADGTAGDQQGRRALLLLVDAMQLSQEHLLHGDPKNRILPPTSDAIQDIYFSPEQHLAASVDEFLMHARRFAVSPDATPRNPDLVALRREAKAPLLKGLDRALQQYGQDAESDILALQRSMTLLTGAMLLTVLLEAVFVYRPLFLRMSRAMHALSQASITDGLTGMLNRRALLEAAERDWERAREEGMPMCLIMADLDHFKQVNDRFGHATGDAILREFATAVEETLRRGDKAGRLGGEEFVLVLPHSGMAGGRLVAERLRSRFAERAAELLPQETELRPTVSMGIVATSGESSIGELIEKADELLYRAKSEGRNRVIAVEEVPLAVSAVRAYMRLADDPA